MKSKLKSLSGKNKSKKNTCSEVRASRKEEFKK